MIFVEPLPAELKAARNKVWGVWEGGRELDCRVAYALGMQWIDPAWAFSGTTDWRDHVEKNGYEGAWNNDHVYGRDDGVPHLTTSLDAIRTLHWTILPSHDYLNINADPSGFGCEIGNWFLSENILVDHAKASAASLELAYLAAVLTAYLGKITDTGTTKSMGEPNS